MYYYFYFGDLKITAGRRVYRSFIYRRIHVDSSLHTWLDQLGAINLSLSHALRVSLHIIFVHFDLK